MVQYSADLNTNLDSNMLIYSNILFKKLRRLKRHICVYEIILTALSWVNIQNVIFTEDEFNKNEVHFLVVGLFIHPHSDYLYMCARRQHLIYM